MQNDLLDLNLGIICKCAFGYQFNSVTERRSKILSAFQNLMQSITLKYDVFQLVPILKNIPTEKKKKELMDMKVIMEAIDQVRNKLYN